MAFHDFKLVTKADAAAIFGVCVKTIDNYIKDGAVPEPVGFVSREYWHPVDFQAFLDKTFLRQAKALDASAHVDYKGSPADAEPTISAATPPKSRAPIVASRDSNPAVRQQTRQKARLHALNSPSAN